MILIVDDDQTIRLSIGLMLRQAGFEYEAVATEADAVAAMRRGNVDLAILDMNLTLSTTGQQGIEILRKFRILAPTTPIILISAWATVPLAVEGMKYGAVDFVTKPWANRDFMAKIRKALAAAEKAKDSEKVDSLDNTERQAIEKALRQSDGNLTSAAQLLGITRQSLYRRMEKFGLK
ncbi:MAG: response regulator [Muribaculaceae bacterium]|nr:response regulator [Muribaculaceae bacterium]